MESTGKPGCIHASAEAHALITGPEEDAEGTWHATGGVEAKGKGLLKTFLWEFEKGGGIRALWNKKGRVSSLSLMQSLEARIHSGSYYNGTPLRAPTPVFFSPSSVYPPWVGRLPR